MAHKRCLCRCSCCAFVTGDCCRCLASLNETSGRRGVRCREFRFVFECVLMHGVLSNRLTFSLLLLFIYLSFFCLWPLPKPKAPRVMFPLRELWVKLKCRLNTRGFSVQFFLVELIVFKGWTFAWRSLVDSFTQICKANRRSNRSSQPSELDEAGSPD